MEVTKVTMPKQSEELKAQFKGKMPECKCGNLMTANVYRHSVRRFGKPLCHPCQLKRGDK